LPRLSFARDVFQKPAEAAQRQKKPLKGDALLDFGGHLLDGHPVLDLFQPGLFPLLNGASHAQGAMAAADGMADVEMAEAFNEIVVCHGFVGICHIESFLCLQ
jgi:hypothetical protein